MQIYFRIMNIETKYSNNTSISVYVRSVFRKFGFQTWESSKELHRNNYNSTVESQTCVCDTLSVSDNTCI